ncbi:Mss4-like protein [Truncatella angustata]|uniref:Mss4-like protein n=1 Tax=Truncatella angustata TaxID=152316 RepID=A0A9P8ZZK9_9PEZI|nr:Mss4-like protein [Truncatella angustata]KAH6657362.1 Mss4-like protein [Truncatella angustata]KAH8194505.1 hypothetical protein TruAng_011328 [Truncatella angustata]
MAQIEAQEKTVAAQCYCKSVHFTLTLKTSDLPLNTHLCHCSICRYSHGTLCVFHATLPDNVAPHFVAPSSQDKLTSYRIPNADTIYYFCSTCGCHIGGSLPDYTDWTVSTSIFTNNEPVYQINSHVFSQSALGGGYNDFLFRIGDRDMKDWNPKGDSARPKYNEAAYGADSEERLRAECHCGGVSFTVPRPRDGDRDDPEMKRIVSPVDKRKWIATIDACDDCRLTSGTHVVSWTFIPLDRCEPSIKPDLLIGTMKTFESSPDVLRSFCGVCGAVIFYSCHDRKNIVDLAVGVLRAPEGVKAENWLTWQAGRIGWEKDGLQYNEEFILSLAEGFKKWSMEKYGHVGDSRSV